MRRMRGIALGLLLTCTLALAVGAAAPVMAQTKPEGELKFALYVTISPQWFDPGEVTGFITPFWFLYAMHDALVKNMPGKTSAPCLAESWTVSADQKVYDFKLREGLKFHNGDPFTAEDVRFSFYRAKGYKILKEKVRDVEVAGPYRVRFHLQEPWPDFMTFYGTLVSGAGWIVPKKYVEQVGDDGFKKHPVGLGPYKFVSHTPGVELVLEAFEGYWRKVPSVKRLVLKSVPESTTRVAMLKRGEVDIAYLLEVPQAEEIKRRPEAQGRVHRRRRQLLHRFLRHVGSQVPVGRPARAAGREPRHRPESAERGGDAGRLAAQRRVRAQEPGVRHDHRAACLRPGEGQEAPRRGGLSERLRRRRLPLGAPVLLRG